MSYRNDRFNMGTWSLDMMPERYTDLSRNADLSDVGNGIRQMMTEIDFNPVTYRLVELLRARLRLLRFVDVVKRLVEGDSEHLIPVLIIIMDDRGYLREILQSVSRATYYRNRSKLAKFFSVRL